MNNEYKKKMKRTIGLLLLFTIIITYATNFTLVNTYVGYHNTDFTEISALIPHTPIIIDSDDDFITLGFPGSGTIGDPYRIEEYDITTSEEYGISISDVTSYFLISNCYVDATGFAIYVKDVIAGITTIENNTCANTNYGIYLTGSSGSTVIENTCLQNTDHGILLTSSPNSLIINNTFSMNYYGMLLTGSANSNIINNTFVDNTANSFRFSYSSDISILNNTFISSNGAYIGTCSGTTLANNTFYNDGVHIRESSVSAYQTYTVENNTVNDKPLGFYVNYDFGVFSNSDYGQLILVDCLDVVVRNQILTDTYIGLFLAYCENTTSINNTCSNGYVGIYFYENIEGIVKDNICFNNHKGIHIDSSNGGVLVNNSVYNNDDGISIHSASDVTILDNDCPLNNHHGIYLSSSTDILVNTNLCHGGNDGIQLYECTNSNVTGNVIYSNNYQGLSVSHCTNIKLVNNSCSESRSGISVLESTAEVTSNICHDQWTNIYISASTLNISGNTCYNGDIGMNFYNVDFSNISYNTLTDNSQYGIQFDSSSNNNSIHHNTFTTTIQDNPSQAFDDGQYNVWYDTSVNEGNVWSDWTGSSDYQIDGLAGSVDPYPYDWMQPMFVTPLDVSYAIGGTGNIITWIVNELTPLNYSIYRDTTLIDSDMWDGSDIVVNVDGLAIGSYEYKCVVFDENENFAFDIVDVTVGEDYPPTISSPLDNIVSEGSIGNVIPWMAEDIDAGTYILLVNGIEEASAEWNSGVYIVISIDGLTVGVYNYTIVVYDRMGNFVVDTVVITIIPIVPEFDNIPLAPLFILNLLLTAVVIIYIFKRKKK